MFPEPRRHPLCLLAFALSLGAAACAGDDGESDSGATSEGEASAGPTSTDAGTGGSSSGGVATDGSGGQTTGATDSTSMMTTEMTMSGTSTAGTTAATGTSGSTGATTSETTGALGGCGEPSPYVAGANELSVMVDGVPRTLIVAMPDDYDEDMPYPLVFAWHGLGGNGALARLYFGVEQQAAGAAIFVYPDGLPVMGGTGWDLIGDQDLALFDALHERFSDELCVDQERVFSTGHSFGGYWSNVLGCKRGDVLRAIAPVAGGGPFTSCAGQVAVWLTHGDNDAVVEFSEGEGSRDHWLAENSCGQASAPTDPPGCVAYEGCDDGYPVHWCVHSQDHDWPDFAAAAIWSFLSQL